MQATDSQKTINAVNEAIAKEIAKSVQGLSFGTVTIKVHNSKIVQLEVTENKRFDDFWANQNGSGI